jgi:hypothetical protein
VAGARVSSCWLLKNVALMQLGWWPMSAQRHGNVSFLFLFQKYLLFLPKYNGLRKE